MSDLERAKNEALEAMDQWIQARDRHKWSIDNYLTSTWYERNARAKYAAYEAELRRSEICRSVRALPAEARAEIERSET